jgi:hypothetical protein
VKDATFTLDGHEIRVLDGPYLRDGVPTAEARAYAATLVGLLDAMRVFAAVRYLPIYNDSWREEDDLAINEAEFCERLTNPGIVLYDEMGAAVVYFDDSDMFAGHTIEVSVDNGKITHASMLG